MPPTRDLIIIGAGFAGLACARRAAERGLSVLVLDRKSQPGERIHTTGILVKEAWEEWEAPDALVRRINRVRVYTPSHQFVELERDSYHFMATDTARLMDHLVGETRRAGAEVRFGETFRGASRQRSGLTLEGSGVTGRFLVGADGARSRVAESFGLDRNVRLLKGVEWEFEPLDSVGDCLHCFIDPQCAPGYIGWVVPGVGVTQVGWPSTATAGPTCRSSSRESTAGSVYPQTGCSRSVAGSSRSAGCCGSSTGTGSCS